MEGEVTFSQIWNRPLTQKIKWAVIIILPVVLFFVSFSIGRYPMNAKELLYTVYYHFTDPSKIADGNMERALFNIRLPRVLATMLVGAGLSVTGAAYQGLFRNPIVSPDILGASAGAGFGASLGMLLGLATTNIQLLAFTGGILAVIFTTAINRSVARDALLGLVLGGVMVQSLFTAFTSYIKLVADQDDKLPAITFWLMGGFHSMNTAKLLSILIPMLISILVLFFLRWQLNVFSFGDEEAQTLGVRTKAIRYLIIVAGTIITASAVSVVGMVGWVGLIIPHLGRILVGANYNSLIPASALLGASYLLLVDDIARNVWAVEIPIGILTAVLGVPLFLIIYRINARR